MIFIVPKKYRGRGYETLYNFSVIFSSGIVLIGEIGGQAEENAAAYLTQHNSVSSFCWTMHEALLLNTYSILRSYVNLRSILQNLYSHYYVTFA